MDGSVAESSWTRLERLLEEASPEEVRTYFTSLPAEERVLAASRLSERERALLVEALAPGEAAELVQHLPEPQAVDAIGDVEAETAARILRELPSDEEADLLHELTEDRAEAILAELPVEEAVEARALKAYPDDSAGGLMVTEFVAYPQERTVAEVLADLRLHRERYAGYDVQYVYVVDARGRLVGVLRLRDLLLAPPGQAIADLMVPDPFRVAPHADLDRLRAFFDEHPFHGVPVVDAEGRLLGVVLREAVQEALRERADADYRLSKGLLREEIRSMPLWLRARRRLSWLSINVVLNLVAASVIAAFQDTLSRVVALAVFLPIISDMSGCSGNQAVGVSMRELALGLVRPHEVWRVWRKEVVVGLLNGVLLGGLVAVIGALYSGSPWFGFVVGAALLVNTVVSVSIGGVVPLLLKRFGVDPAAASGPILTTVTDMCGFFFALGLAALLMERLQAA